MWQHWVGRAPSPARRPLPPLPAAGRGRPARSRGTAPPSPWQNDYLSQADTHLAEIYDTAAGQRYMNATLNGTTVFTSLDVWTAAGGPNRAHDLSYPITVTNGQVTITLTCTSSNT